MKIDINKTLQNIDEYLACDAIQAARVTRNVFEQLLKSPVLAIHKSKHDDYRKSGIPRKGKLIKALGV